MSKREELAQVLEELTDVLLAHNVPYFVTGSVAGMLHGEFRATNDVDVVAEFTDVDITALMKAFAAHYLSDEAQAREAIASGSSFNLIHTETYLKVDLFPLTSDFNRAALARALATPLPGTSRSIHFATAEDLLLAKLRWYRLGQEQSEVQRRDIVGIVSLNAGQLDRKYLAIWAADLGVSDLLKRFLRD